MVEDIAADAETEVHEQNVQRLSIQQRILLESIRERGEVAAGELHAEYEKHVGTPKSKPTRQRYLQSLERYRLVEQVGRTRGTYYRCCE